MSIAARLMLFAVGFVVLCFGLLDYAFRYNNAEVVYLPETLKSLFYCDLGFAVAGLVLLLVVTLWD